MAFVLLFINFIGLTLLNVSIKNTRVSLLKSVLLFSVLVLGVTETLSLFQWINYINLLVLWSFADLIVIYFLIKRNSFQKFYALKAKLKRTTSSLTKLEQFLLLFSGFIIVGVLIQGLAYPTNNWDSMSYHMARIIHWIQNESLAYYRTPVYPQLNSPPFAEELILTINLLAGNDYFSNTVQLFYLVATALGVSLIAKQLGLNRFGQILSVFIFICIPEVILLGSSTHTELVASFFMVAAIFYMLSILKKQSLISFLLLGFSLGLSTATKSTAYIYLAPFVLIWIGYMLYQIITKKLQLKWIYYLLMVVSFISINSGHYARNYQSTVSIFGTNDAIQDYYVNEEHSLKMMVSNVSRNLSNQFGVPKLAPIAQAITENLHKLMGSDINDVKITSHTYTVDPLATHENNGANTYHMILMLLSSVCLVVFFKNQNQQIRIYWVAIICSFLLFCFYLKWQPWAKLHVPFFIFFSIVLSYFIIFTLKSKWLLYGIITGFMVHALTILVFNYSRPLITLTPFTSEIKITDTRYKKYFGRFLRYHDDYKTVSEMIEKGKFKNIGLSFGKYDMEYQLFLNSYRSDVKPVHINTCDLSMGISNKEQVDCIVSTKHEHVIKYRGEKYYNVTKGSDGYLYLFLKH
ncbi:MAG: glycosyltransferase family 39 protein [Flavobacteriales bacterium]|nr:glycosyltransferase family 39 protein [Flavobacteriales bacterium]